MKKIFYLLTAITLLGIGCTKAPITLTPTPTPDAPKYQTYSNLGVSITPLEVAQDSRCPKDAQCVWAGTVEIRAQVASIGGIYEQSLKLGEPVAVTNFGRVIELTGVVPDKELNKTILPGEYKFTFSVTTP